jgi:hypothetical protein
MSEGLLPAVQDVVKREPPNEPEEVLRADPRAGLTPTQFVERKLVAMLQRGPLPVSRMQSSRLRRPPG